MQYFEQSNENMEVELQLIIVLLSFYNTRHLAYSRSWLQEEEDKRVDNPLKERVLGSMHNYIIMSNSRKDFPHRLTPVIIFTSPFPRPASRSVTGDDADGCCPQRKSHCPTLVGRKTKALSGKADSDGVHVDMFIQ